jgi:hypothetical protein
MAADIFTGNGRATNDKKINLIQKRTVDKEYPRTKDT